jgi:hypothetical protein
MSLSSRFDRTGRPVILSLEDETGSRCVDVISAEDGHRFKEFRRDVEDNGCWTLVSDYSDRVFATRDEALEAAARTIRWLAWPESA